MVKYYYSHIVKRGEIFIFMVKKTITHNEYDLYNDEAYLKTAVVGGHVDTSAIGICSNSFVYFMYHLGVNKH